MTSIADLLIRLDVADANAVEQVHSEDFIEDIAVLAPNGQRTKLILANGNTALGSDVGRCTDWLTDPASATG